MEAVSKPNKTETGPRKWRSMSDLHIDITEALEYLVGRFGTLNEKDIQGVADYLGIDLALVQGVAEELGVSS
jgi:NADH:ubiquinone oxidoreductase subunit E